MSFQMPIFAFSGSSDTASEKRRQILEHIHDVSPTDQQSALQELYREAQASDGDEQTWSDLALGLFHTGHFEDACQLYRKLAEAFPAQDIYLLNIATCLSQMAQPDLCQHQLEQIKIHGNSEGGRQTATQLIEELTRWRRQSVQEQQFADLKRTALQERVEAGEAEPEEYVELARLLLQQESGDLGDVEAATDLARQALEQGEKRFPEFAPILEHLAYVYCRTPGAQAQIDAVLQRLQRVAPDSSVLELSQSASLEEARAFSQRMRGRAFELMRICEGKDPQLVEAALRDLQKMVAMFAQSPEYRKTYAFALMISGRKNEALREAEILASFGDDSHDVHFHLGQIFAGCGDEVRGLRHLEQALESAPTAEDRQMTLDLIAQRKETAKAHR